MKKTLRLLVDTEIGGQTFKAGEFIEIDADLATDLIEGKRAVAQTPEEYKVEQEKDALDAQRKRWQQDKVNRVGSIRVIADESEKIAAAPKGGFKSFRHFVVETMKAGTPGNEAPETLRKWNAAVRTVGSDEMASDVGSDGGFLVPTEFRATLMQNSLEASVIAPRATAMPMQTNSLEVPYINETTRASTTHGGVTVAARAERGQMTARKPAIGKLTLRLRELYALAYLTNELVQDSPISAEALISKVFGEAIAFERDDLYFWGTGAAQSLGFMNSPALVTVSKEVGQAATTILAENIFKMYSRMNPAGIARAVWVSNNDTFPQLCGMHIKVGTAGVPIWLPGSSAAGTPNGTLLGRPLVLTEKCQTVGTLGDIAFCDFAEYLVGVKAGQAEGKMESSIHIRFDYNEVAFRLVLRHDGQPWWSSPVTPRRSTNTVSPFVVLESRA